MRIFWLNGHLALEPQGQDEEEALCLLYEAILTTGLKVGRETSRTGVTLTDSQAAVETRPHSVP